METKVRWWLNTDRILLLEITDPWIRLQHLTSKRIKEILNRSKLK